jgi:hypothetical protein
LLLLFEEEKRDANLFGLTVPIEILSQVQKKADVSKPGKSGKGARVEAVAFKMSFSFPSRAASSSTASSMILSTSWPATGSTPSLAFVLRRKT